MLVLRRISGDGVEMNQVVGKGYTYIHREVNPDQFRETFKLYFKKDHVADLDPTADKETTNCYAFVVEGSFIQALYKNQKAFMMTESGKTFANLSYRDGQE